MPLQHSEWLKHYGSLPDGGPVYAETDLSHFIAEPWNAISSLAIMAPAIYWAWKLRGHYRKYTFLFVCMPLLIIGSIGSTLFHAFRTYELFLLMDFLPIVLLSILVSIFLWKKVIGNWYWIALIFGMAIIFRLWVEYAFSPHNAMNISYFSNGVMMFFPALIYLARNKFQGWGNWLASIVLFVFALLFRKIDATGNTGLEMGTHWLWHVFCGAGAFYISKFLVQVSRKSAEIEARTSQ